MVDQVESKNTITVEVAFALLHKQRIIELDVPVGTTAKDAVAQSNIAAQFPEHDVLNADVGIFGKSVKADTVLNAGDRVEIYRPLIVDPKEVRKRRAEEAKAKRLAEKEQEKSKA
ncbi:MAG: RnfH family protein [Pseudomonadota bacterium]